MPKIVNKTRFLTVLAGGAVAIGAVGAGIWWWQTQAKMGQLPDGVTLIPETALYTLTVSTDAPPWQLVQAAGLFESQGWLQGPWGPVSPEGIELGDIDVARDILPWLGAQATFASLPMTPDTALVSSDAPLVWIVPIPENANLDALRATLEQQPKEVHEGVTIYQVPGPVEAVAGQGIAFISQGSKEYLAWSNIAVALEQIIDTAQGQPALASRSRYQDAVIATGGENPQAQFYVNLPAYFAETSPSSLPPESDLGGLAAAFRLQDNQVRVRAMTWLPEDSQRNLTQEGTVNTLTQKLPENTLATFTTSNFQASWRNAPQDWQRTIRDGFEPVFGVNPEQAFVPWLDGEFTLALIPVPNARLNVVSVVMIAQTQDRPKAEAALQTLDQNARQKGWQVSQDDQTQITSWRMLPGIPLAHHGWLDAQTFFLTLGPNITQALVPPPEPNLAQLPLFRSTLPSPGSSQLFVDFNNLFSITQRSPIMPDLAPAFQQTLQPFRGLGISGRVRNAWSQEYEIRLELNR